MQKLFEIQIIFSVFLNENFQFTRPLTVTGAYKKPNGEVWKLVFTGYEGSGQGKYIFDSEKISEGSGTIGLEESMTKEINFYPNPSKGILYFSDQVDHVSVYNTMGQLVYERRETLKSIDLNGLNTGSYFVKMSNENSSSHRILIIE